MKIGESLKRMREQVGLTLEELASRSELNAGYLSRLERDLSSPTVETLSSLARVYGLRVAELFDGGPPEEARVLRARERKGLLFHGGRVRLEPLAGAPEFPGMEAMLVSIEPRTPAVWAYAHPGQSFFYVVEGTLEARVGMRRRTLHAGDSIFVGARVSQTWANRTRKTSVMFAVTSPPGFIEIVRKAGFGRQG